MRLTLVQRLSATAAALAKRPKSDMVLVDCKSFATDFNVQRVRPRMADKLEFECWDPMVQRRVLFKETKKVRTLPAEREHRPSWSTLEIVHEDGKPQQTEEWWYRLPDTEGRTWGKGKPTVYFQQGKPYPPYE